MLLLRFLKRLVIVTINGVLQVSIDVGIIRQNRHQGEIFVASGAKRPKTLYIRDGHTRTRLPRKWPVLRFLTAIP
jgi:hypothetical protein